MDYRNYNNRDYRRNPGNSNNKRRVQSVQDMISPNDRRAQNHSARNRSRQRTGSYETAEFSGGIDSLAGVIFVVLMAICILSAVIFYKTGGGRKTGYYPLDVVTINGVLNDAYAGRPGAPSDSDLPPAPSGASTVASNPAGNAASEGSAEPVAQTAATGVTGAAMLLDAGGGVEGYPEATSYAELLTQIESALEAGDINFIGSKIGYTDDSTGSALGFPQSVVEHFVQYMTENPDKRQGFMDTIRDDAKFDGVNGTAHIVNLPMIRYRVTTDYDETTFSFSGFSEQTINANQEATVAPLLPCMYTVTAKCPSWAQPIEGQLEASFGENLEVNFGTN